MVKLVVTGAQHEESGWIVIAPLRARDDVMDVEVPRRATAGHAATPAIARPDQLARARRDGRGDAHTTRDLAAACGRTRRALEHLSIIHELGIALGPSEL